MADPTLRYAGLDRALDPGLSVLSTSDRGRRFAYAERTIMRLLASRIVTLPDRGIKALLARLQYEHAQRADGWRARVLELRTPKSKLEGAPDAALEIVFDEAEHLPATYPFLMAVTRILKVALSNAYRQYIDDANELADYAGVRLSRMALAEELQHQQMLDRALATLEPSAEEYRLADEWMERLASFLGASGGIDGTAPRTEPVPRHGSTKPFTIAHSVVRDSTIPRVWDYVAPPFDDVDAHLSYMMGLRLSEINVAEGLAIVLCETSAMPWSFYLDISRHCWDEMRHSLFGEAAIEATFGDHAVVPMRDYEGVFVMESPPLEQYAVLGLEVEGKNMKYPPGKRQEWEFARDMARHPLMTTLQDFDWADEVVHVNIARRQLDGWFEGGLKTIGEFSRAGKEHRTAVKQRYAATIVAPPTPRGGD